MRCRWEEARKANQLKYDRLQGRIYRIYTHKSSESIYCCNVMIVFLLRSLPFQKRLEGSMSERQGLTLSPTAPWPSFWQPPHQLQPALL